MKNGIVNIQFVKLLKVIKISLIVVEIVGLAWKCDGLKNSINSVNIKLISILFCKNIFF